jgi:hypothetical protein
MRLSYFIHWLIERVILNSKDRCHEADAFRLLRVRIKTFGQYTVLGFRSCGKWSEMNSLFIRKLLIMIIDRNIGEVVYKFTDSLYMYKEASRNPHRQ